MNKFHLSENFTLKELGCKCEACLQNGHFWNGTPPMPTLWLMDSLQHLRDAWGAPIHINSGCRCQAHNAAVGGTQTSLHTRGCAVDVDPVIWFDREIRWSELDNDGVGFDPEIPSTYRKSGGDYGITRFLRYAVHHGGFVGFGIAKTFIHLDVRPALVTRKPPAAWAYVGKRRRNITEAFFKEFPLP